MISRRQLLLGLAAAPAALILPELIIRQRTYFLPPKTAYLIDPEYLSYNWAPFDPSLPTVHEIVAETLRKAMPRMIENVTSDNAVLRLLQRRMIDAVGSIDHHYLVLADG